MLSGLLCYYSAIGRPSNLVPESKAGNFKRLVRSVLSKAKNGEEDGHDKN